MQFRFGIEHEVAFVRSDGRFADFTNTTYDEFAAIVAALPEYAEDMQCLRLGDAGIRCKRWYIEGIERFDPTGKMRECRPKGIEIRTTIQTTIAATIQALQSSFDQLQQVAQTCGFTPILTSFNPNQTAFIPHPPLNQYEIDRLNTVPEDRTEHLAMLTYGPDLNLSVANANVADLIDWGRKLTYYSPYILPFSYSHSIYRGQPWTGYSVRTFYRTGARPAVLVFVADAQDLIDSDPSLTKQAQITAEVGRLEFKAFDSCNFELYASLLALLKGLMRDRTLLDRATTPNAALHQHSARWGFDDRTINGMADKILTAATIALQDDPDCLYLQALRDRHTSHQEKAWLHRSSRLAQVNT